MTSNTIPEELLFKLQKNIDLFRNFSLNEINWFLEKGEKVVVPQNTIIIKEHTNSNLFYVILKGNVKITYLKDYSHTEFLCERHAGNIVGEIGALFNLARTATVEALESTVLLKFSSSIFSEAEKENPYLAMKIYKNIAEILVDRYVQNR